MQYSSLYDLIEKLKSSPRVRGIFTTGSTASKMNPASDIDFVVVLDNNSERIKSLYAMIENRFSDIFFFDIEFLKQLQNKKGVSGNDFGGIFLDWLMSGKIEYDPKNLLSKLKNKIKKNCPSQKVTGSAQRDFWLKINYNFIANSRYYNFGDKLYHTALEMRLLHSVIELITAYFSFRGIPWRGEKAAVKYLAQNDHDFISIFRKYAKSNTLRQKMKYYEKMFNTVFFGDYQAWEKDFVIPISQKNGYDPALLDFWHSLTNGAMT